jgi:hypothetical protein
MIVTTFTGYVTSKGVESKLIQDKYQVYILRLRGELRPKKGVKKVCVAEFTFWGKNYEYLQKFIAPYDHITAVGELLDTRSLPPKGEDEMEMIMLYMRGLTCALPKREDADGANKTRVSQQRRETLKPEPPAEKEEEIPF